MESSEDDAGTATNASRRDSAREKEIGRLEDVEATSSYLQDSTEARTSCQTPAMSEDNFDGDSVPSPSAQYVNTSTEAILDMIDEIVDGPGAPKRLPLLLDTDAESAVCSSEHQNIESAGLQKPEDRFIKSESVNPPISDIHQSNSVESNDKCTEIPLSVEISVKSESDSIPCVSVVTSNVDSVNNSKLSATQATISEYPQSEPKICVSSDYGDSTCIQRDIGVNSDEQKTVKVHIMTFKLLMKMLRFKVSLFVLKVI
ncbi:unnamed protein product [Leptosia nina]|uniref:Uncharacterized protein n=1 Tax=Leptosia nina TaxID=320188 RepID=A0AAV1J0U9_9NEOP